MSLPTGAKSRKDLPIGTGVLDYFPDALIEVAKVSLQGQKQHGLTGQLKWDRTKSTDESDALIRHYLDRYKVDSDGMLHAAKMAWRALAFLQKLCESKEKEAADNQATDPNFYTYQLTNKNIDFITTITIPPGSKVPILGDPRNWELVRMEISGAQDGERPAFQSAGPHNSHTQGSARDAFTDYESGEPQISNRDSNG